MRRYLPDGDEAVEHDTREHEDLERTMKSLEAVDALDSRFEELVRHLEETLRDHIQDEESDQFPQLRAKIPRDELVQMAGRVQAAKAVAPTRPHPSTPNNPVVHAPGRSWGGVGRPAAGQAVRSVHQLTGSTRVGPVREGGKSRTPRRCCSRHEG